jgi:hypothetical protein
MHHRRNLIAAVVPVFAILGFVVTAAQAGSRKAEKIVARHVAAIGGKRLKSVGAFRAVGTAEVRGMTVPMTLWKQRPDRSRLDLTILGHNVTQAYDGDVAWWINPMVSAPRPTEMPGDFAREMKLWSDFDGPLVNHKGKRHTIDYLGQETIGTGAAHKLRVVLRDGTEIHSYIDSQTYFEVKRTHTQIYKERPVKVDTHFSEFVAFDGVTAPRVIKGTGFGGEPFTMRFQTVDFDVESDDTRFEMPGRSKRRSGYGR